MKLLNFLIIMVLAVVFSSGRTLCPTKQTEEYLNHLWYVDYPKVHPALFIVETIEKSGELWNKYIDIPIRRALDYIRGLFRCTHEIAEDCLEEFKQRLMQKIQDLLSLFEKSQQEASKLGLYISYCTYKDKDEIEAIPADLVDIVNECLMDKVQNLHQIFDYQLTNINNSHADMNNLRKEIDRCRDATGVDQTSCMELLTEKINVAINMFLRQLNKATRESKEYLLIYKSYYFKHCTHEKLADVGTQGEAVLKHTSSCIRKNFPELVEALEGDLNHSCWQAINPLQVVLTIGFVYLLFIA